MRTLGRAVRRKEVGGEPLPVGEDLEEFAHRVLPKRILDRIEFTDACWIYTGYVYGDGYGVIRHEGRKTSAHRRINEILMGHLIPGHLQLDHLCLHRRCVNPMHEEVVTARVNTLRAPNSPAGINARRTHCVHGHEFNEENTYHHDGRRRCKACYRRRDRERTARLRAARGVRR